MLRGHRIADWNPENASAWDAGNNVIARRNLLWSIVTAHVAFSVWSLGASGKFVGHGATG
jgi:NNP family nitrate/nitrite transporter-like MFS transporter